MSRNQDAKDSSMRRIGYAVENIMDRCKDIASKQDERERDFALREIGEAVCQILTEAMHEYHREMYRDP